ncbi:hypothetical protein SAMN05444169_3704 [Bradyrhizobium erythrophlei]|uniref:Uncharacterized protein n=1 Tax=Bradyrhizobium erythrophlei TaxID=1437360 RepID=A0A1M5LWX3_9BRAD|nr:hypothetical protein SAMN05444169_3704 [Bradyrhizobium erythrophlei]
MPKRRTNKHRGAISEHHAAWLDGDRKAGFLVSLNHGFVLQELWDRAGDSENFRWEPGMQYPEPR